MKKYLIHITTIFLISISLSGCGTIEGQVDDADHEFEDSSTEETQSDEVNQLLTDDSFEFSWNDIEYSKEENSLFIEMNTNLPDNTVVNLSLTVSQPDDWGEEFKDFYEYRSRLEQKVSEVIVNDGLIQYTFDDSDFRGDLLPNAIYYALISIPVYDDVNNYIKDQFNNRDDFENAYPNLDHDFWIFDHGLENYNDYELKFHMKEEVQNAHSLADIFNFYEENTIPFKDVKKNPSKYEGVHATYSGEIIELHEMEDEVESARTNSLIRLAVNGDSDTILLIGHRTTNGMEGVYKGDEITVYGNLMGSFTYESASGNQITVPVMDAIIYVE